MPYFNSYLQLIKSTDKVVDLGCGATPSPRANVIVDLFVDDDTQRGGASMQSVKNDPRLVIADVCNLPFKDKEFDFSIAGHIAEHVEDPNLFCKEVIRISKTGYIESPSRLQEIIAGHLFHKWIIEVENNKLIFIKKHPFFDTLQDLNNFNRRGANKRWWENFFWNYSEMLHTCFYWQDGFEWEIRDFC